MDGVFGSERCRRVRHYLIVVRRRYRLYLVESRYSAVRETPVERSDIDALQEVTVA